MILRQCDMMYIIQGESKAYTFCEKTAKKKTLNKCLKCIQKTEPRGSVQSLRDET